MLTGLCCMKGCLPQGAPTSATLSNLLMRKFDEKVGMYCRQEKIRYTRYADDMTFSGDFDELKVIRQMIIKLLNIQRKYLLLSPVKTILEVVTDEDCGLNSSWSILRSHPFSVAFTSRSVSYILPVALHLWECATVNLFGLDCNPEFSPHGTTLIPWPE